MSTLSLSKKKKDSSVSKNVCAEAKIQEGGQLIDELTEDMITSQGEQHILQSEKNSGVVLTKSKLNNEEENAQTYSKTAFDSNNNQTLLRMIS